MPKKTYHYGSRRDFIKSSSLALGALAMSAPYFARGQNANSKIRVACIAVGGKGDSDSSHAYEAGGEIVALCDCDKNTLNRKHSQFKERATKDSRTYDAKLFTDWRK